MSQLLPEKRTVILEAAKDEFKKHGFNAANMTTVAQNSKVSKRTLYKHFETKQILFDTVLDELIEQADQLQRVEYCPDKPVESQIYELLEHRFEFVSDQSNQAFLRIVVPIILHDKNKAHWFYERMRKIGMREWMLAAVADKRIKDYPVSFMSAHLIGPIDNQALWPQVLYGLPKMEEALAKKTIDIAAKNFIDIFVLRQ